MEYTIALENLRIQCIIGILPQERKEAQNITINAEFIVAEILDYRHLREFIVESFNKEFHYLEDAHAYFHIEIPRNFPQVKEFYIKITKLEIFADCQVSIHTHYKE